MAHEKKALASEAGQALTDGEGQETEDNHASRMERYSSLKERSEETRDYLLGWADAKTKHESQRARRAIRKLSECGDYLRFHHYFTAGQYRLVDACFCKQFRLCGLCAMRRGNQHVTANLARFEAVRAINDYHFYLVTLTVKDGPDLQERFSHLVKGHKTLQKRRRDFLDKGWGTSMWNGLEGVVGAYEVTKGKSSGQWHPHAHLVVASSRPLPTMFVGFDREGKEKWRCRSLEREWKAITKDSSVVDVRPFNQDDAAKSFCEVFKYALKFSSMTVADQWEAAETLVRRRMIFSYGCFRGVEVPDELTDEPLADLPYVEILYRFVAGSGYNVAHVDQFTRQPEKRPTGWRAFVTVRKVKPC